LTQGLTRVRAIRRWVGVAEDREAGGIGADVTERWAPDLRTLVELTKPTGTRDLFPSREPGYGSMTGQRVRYLPITRGDEVLGYLWAAEDGDAAGYVRQVAAGTDGLKAGALWRTRLAESKRDGLTPVEALRRWIGVPGYLGFGGITTEAEEAEVPDLQALLHIARKPGTPEQPKRLPSRAQPTLRELTSMPSPLPNYRFLTDGPVRYLPVTRGSQVLGYLWAAESDDAADFMSRLDAEADGTYAQGWWIARLSEAHREGLRPLEALRRWAGGPEDPVGGGASVDERVAPNLLALKEVAGRGDEEW